MGYCTSKPCSSVKIVFKNILPHTFPSTKFLSFHLPIPLSWQRWSAMLAHPFQSQKLAQFSSGPCFCNLVFGRLLWYQCFSAAQLRAAALKNWCRNPWKRGTTLGLHSFSWWTLALYAIHSVCSRWSCWQRVELGDLQRSQPTSATLWFCEKARGSG